VGLASMSNPKFLDLTVSQVQNNMGLASMSDPRYLDLTINQVQSNMDMANLPDPKEFKHYQILSFMHDPK